MTDRNPTDDLNPQPMPWEDFEEEVAKYIEKKIADWCLWLNPEFLKVRRKPKYYSKVRESEIKFDVGIEGYPSTQTDTPMFIWIWECKDYPKRTVAVDEVEEFAEKIRQVGAHKGTMVTRLGFQKGAINVAKSYGIGLIVLQKQKVFAIAFSQDAGIIEGIRISAQYSLYTSGKEVKGPELGVILKHELMPTFGK